MVSNLIAGLIVVAALAYTVRHVYRNIGKKPGCGCNGRSCGDAQRGKPCDSPGGVKPV
jgi:hypothetical protein